MSHVSEGCSIVLPYLRSLQKRLLPAAELYDSELSQIGELIDSAEATRCNSTTRRLRAFYAIECMCSVYLAQVLSAWIRTLETAGYEPPGIYLTETPRSWEGLSDLWGQLDKIKDEAIIEATSMDLDGSYTGTAQLLTRSNVDVAQDVLDHCKKAVGLLRGQLKDPSDELTGIGSLLGAAAECSGVYPSRHPFRGQIQEAINIMQISIEHPASGWRSEWIQKIGSQESRST